MRPAPTFRCSGWPPNAPPRWASSTSVGRTASSDVFYHPDALKRYARLRQYGIIAVDMETSALYTVAMRFAARALSICTVVDNMVTGEETHHAERQELFRPMVELALAVVVADAAPG